MCLLSVPGLEGDTAVSMLAALCQQSRIMGCMCSWAQCSLPWPCSNADLALGREESRKMQTEGEYVVALSLSTPLCSVLSGVSALRAELCQSWPGNPLGLHSNNCLLCFVDSGRGIPRGKQQV